LPHSIEATWYFWRNNKVNSNVDGLISFEEMPETITDMSKLPTQLSDFLELFTKTLITAGIDTTFLKKLN
jgi:predicted nucleotidyltransferase